MAVALTVLLLSFAGVPPTAGFFAKLAAAAEVLRQGEALPAWSTGMLGVIFVATLISYYYYLQVLRQVWLTPAETNEPHRQLRWNHRLVFAASACLLLALGFVM